MAEALPWIALAVLVAAVVVAAFFRGARRRPPAVDGASADDVSTEIKILLAQIDILRKQVAELEKKPDA